MPGCLIWLFLLKTVHVWRTGTRTGMFIGRDSRASRARRDWRAQRQSASLASRPRTGRMDDRTWQISCGDPDTGEQRTYCGRPRSPSRLVSCDWDEVSAMPQ